MNRKMRRAENRDTWQHARGNARPLPSQINRASTSNLAVWTFSEAVRRQQAGQLAEAIALYNRALSLNPDLAEAHNNRGVALARLAKLTDAEAAYRRAIAINPDYAEAFNNLGNALSETGRLDEAERALRAAIKLNPRWARCYTNLGLLLKRQGRLAEAEAAHRQAIALDPALVEAYSNLGETLCRLDRPQQAETYLRRAISLNPRHVEALVNLAAALKAQGRLSDAEAACRQAIALKPLFADAHNVLGNILLDLGRLAEAEQALRRAIALQPHFAEAMSNLAGVLRAQGRLIEAESLYRQAIALKPDIAEAHYNLGCLLGEMDRLAEAEAAYRRAIALKPDFADAHNNLAATLQFLGRLADARDCVHRALHLSPRDPSYLLNLSELKRFTIGDPHLAVLEELAATIVALPVKKQIDLHFALAKAYDDLGRDDTAMRQLLAGNALKRQQIEYDEAAALAELERITDVFTPDLMQSLAGAGDTSAVPVFIVGMPRSGTTLIEQILASHADVFGGGELTTMNAVAAGIGALAGRASPFPEVITQLSPRDLRRTAARYLAEATRLAPNARRITDKLPSNFRLAGLIHMMLPNARIIHAMRDPLDTCFSCFSKLFADGQHQTYDLAELGRYYRRYQRMMEHWRRVLPAGRILDICYEDVVADLEGQARRIIAHCGLAWDDRCLVFHKTDRPIHTASAIQVRGPIYRSAIGRAQKYAPFLAPLFDQLSGSEHPLSAFAVRREN